MAQEEKRKLYLASKVCLIKKQFKVITWKKAYYYNFSYPEYLIL